MLQIFKNAQGNIILRAKLFDVLSTTAGGLTGLTSASAGLVISTAASNEAAPVVYTQAGGTIEGIATLGTFAAPTATKCRFKEYQATYHPGVYEFQFADARYAVSNAQSLLVSVNGATNLQQQDFLIALHADDPQMAKLTVRDMLQIEEGAAQDVLITGLQIRAGFSGLIPNGSQLWLETAGTGKWQMSNTTNWDNTTKWLTIDPQWGTLPVLPINYRIFSASSAPTTDATDMDLTDAAVTKVWTRGSLNSLVDGSAGKTLYNTAAAGNPWSALIADNNVALSFGALVQANLNATVASRLAAASFSAAPTAVQNRQEMDANSTKLSALVSATTAIGLKTAALTFTFAGVLDVNSVKIAGVTVLGTGITSDKWRGI